MMDDAVKLILGRGELLVTMADAIFTPWAHLTFFNTDLIIGFRSIIFVNIRFFLLYFCIACKVSSVCKNLAFWSVEMLWAHSRGSSRGY